MQYAKKVGHHVGTKYTRLSADSLLQAVFLYPLLPCSEIAFIPLGVFHALF